MADFNQSVALGINPPDPQGGLNTLNKIMSLGIQGLQARGLQSENVSRAAAATENSQNAKEKMAGAQLLSDPVGNGLVDSDGNPTPDAQKKIMAVMPTTGSQHYEGILNGAKAKVQFNGAINDLRTSERAELANTAGGVATRAESPDDITTALDQLVESKKGTPEYGNYQTIAGTMKTAINHLAQTSKGNNPETPGQESWRQGVFKMVSSILPASSTVGPGGLATPQATTVQTTGGTQGATTAPALQGGGITTKGPVVAAPPTIMASPQGPLVKVAPGGASMAAIPEAGAAQPTTTSKLQPLQRPGLNAPAADISNYNARIKQAGDEQQAVTNAANDPQNGVQVSRYRNGQILDLTKVAPTGPGKEIWNHIASQFPGQGADAFQKIGHYLAQNSAAMAGKMGVPNTNMGQETAQAAAGNVAQNPEAIKEITKVNDAINTGFDLYNRGLAKVTNNGSDLSRVPAYKQAFGQNVDVNALRWADANRRNDREEIANLSKQGPQAIAAWQKKLATLKSLATAGDLP